MVNESDPLSSVKVEGEETKNDSLKKKNESTETETVGNYLLCGMSELSGVALLVFVACLGCTNGVSGEKIGLLQISLTWGLAVMTSVHIFGHISGAHLNPAVSISGYFMGQANIRKTLVYICFQIVGALAGYSLVLLVVPKEYISGNLHCLTLPHEQVGPIKALIIEITISFMLCLSVNAAWDKRNQSHVDSLSLRIGLIVTVGILAAGPYTGASMNPARSIGPAIWNRNAKSLYLYIVGPMIGGSLSGFIYKNLLLEQKKIWNRKNRK